MGDRVVKKISLIKDKYFRNGFDLRGLGGTDNDARVVKTIQFGTEKNAPNWAIGQWSAKYSFADGSVSTIKESSENVYEIISPTNHLTVDTNNATLVFDCTTSKNYDTPRRTDQGWHHLLVETTFTDINDPDGFTKLSEIKDIQVECKIKLLKFEDKMLGQADPDVHAAQFLLYLTIHNANKASKGFGEMIWFGLSFLDNRKEWEDESSQYDIGTKALIVGGGNQKIYPEGVNMFRDGRPYAGEDSPVFPVKVNFLETVKKAYTKAREEGYFQESELEDLYITGMNIGWEVPGTYDVAMQLSDFDISVMTD